MKNLCLLLVPTMLVFALAGCSKNPQNEDNEEFDPGQRLVERVVYNAGSDFDENFLGSEVDREAYSYYGDGRLKKYSRTKPSLGIVALSEYTYGDKKCIVRGINPDHGYEDAVEEILYIDEDMKYPEKVYYYSSEDNYSKGVLFAEETFEYDSGMRKTGSRYEHADGNPVGDFVRETRNYVYGEKRCTYEVFTDIVNRDQAVTIDYYDDSYNMVKEITRLGFYSTEPEVLLNSKYEYDENGLVTKYWRDEGDIEDNTGYVYKGKECRYNRTFTYTDFGEVRYYKVMEKYE